MILTKVKEIMTNPNFRYSVSNFFKESAKHPYLMSTETAKFFSHWVFCIREEPKQGFRFEQHSHSHFSDGANLADIVDLLLDKRIALWSLTDHQNSKAFDSIANGKYDLNKENKTGKKFEVEVQSDKRALIIYSGNAQIVLLRSVEYCTDKGEINIHGYSGQIPKKIIRFEDAIKLGIDAGGWIAINHPYLWQGLAYLGRQNIELAAKIGAIAIEKNGTEIPPQIFCPVKASLDAKEFGLALLASGDAHKLHMYGMSGLTFNNEDYLAALKQCNGNHADSIKQLVASKNFETYLNYLTPKQFLDFFKFDAQLK